MSKYFFGARPITKGGNIWAQFCLLHDVEIETLLIDTKEDLKSMDVSISIQTIQHYDVSHIGFLKNLHWDVDLDSLTEFFNALNRIYKNKEIIVGLKVKTPYDGKKRNNNTTTSFRDRIQAVHVDVKADHAEKVKKALKNILQSESFLKRYSIPVRLIPIINVKASPYLQDKVQKCIVQHGQLCQCVNSMACNGIDYLDQKNTKLKQTVRELIIGLPGAHFINVDLNWRKDSYVITYPKKYEEIAQDHIANLGPYLHKAYGDDILSSLPTETQEVIQSTTWDEKTGRPISQLDLELDGILNEDDTLDIVDLTIIKDNDVINTPPRISNSFIPKLDDNTVSTFGESPLISPSSSKDKSERSRFNDTNTTYSDVTIESRVTKMETSFNRMEDLLERIVNFQQNSVLRPPGPADVIMTADSLKEVSAASG